jgi:hypothetical protein
MFRKLRLARMVLVALVVMAFVALIGRASVEVLKGNGAATYSNAYGMQIHWITLLSLSAALIMAWVVAIVIRWWQRRDDRTIDRLLKKQEGSEHRKRLGNSP